MGGTGTAHPFTGYNKADIHGALVGNWVEERALEASTGVFRYKEWVKADNQQVDSVYATKVGAPESISTYARALEHSDRLEAKEWETSNQAVFQAPAQRESDLRVYVDPKRVGVRTTAMLKMLQAEAAVPPPEPPLEKYLESTKQASYQAYDLTGVVVGQKVMKTSDNVVIPEASKDATFRAEAGIIKKDVIDRLGTAPVPPETFAENYTDATPISLYSQRAQEGKFPSNVIFGSDIKGPNPFAKTSEFSKPISDHTKDPASVC